jgi:hypothetical protein
MALLRWMHTRKLVPLASLIESLERGKPLASPASGPAASLPFGPPAPAGRRVAPPRPVSVPAPAPDPVPPAPPPVPVQNQAPSATGSFKEAFLAEIKRTKAVFFNTAVAQALRIDVDADAIVFTFSNAHKLLGEQVQQNRAWLEGIAERLGGRRVTVSAKVADVGGGQPPSGPGERRGDEPRKPADLKAAVLADPAVQALFSVLPSEIRAIEELPDEKS